MGSIRERLAQGVELQLNGQQDQAEAIYLALLEEESDNPDGNHLLGLIRAEQDQNDEALRLINKAISLMPEMSAFHHNIAGIYRRMGNLADAEREFREAIRLKPDYGESYQGLSEIVRIEADDDLLRQARDQVEKADLDQRTKSYFHFSLGKMYDDCGKYSTAFEHYDIGNNLVERDFSAVGHRNLIKSVLYEYSPDRVASPSISAANSSSVPVFIVGMPRSGSTLIEQIIASHSEAFGAGELNDIKSMVSHCEKATRPASLYPHFIGGLTQQQKTELAAAYHARISALAAEGGKANAQRVVDKHPMNFHYVGLILELFPNARIIHTRRDALDTCLSCFCQNFTKGQNYSFNLSTLANFYKDYVRLMAHWEQLYPNSIMTVDYEHLVAEQEQQSRKLIDFINLDWQDACLNFHETRRVVKTASFMQVRQPIYKSSIGRWKNYRQQLSGVAKILNLDVSSGVQQPITISLAGSRL